MAARATKPKTVGERHQAEPNAQRALLNEEFKKPSNDKQGGLPTSITINEVQVKEDDIKHEPDAKLDDNNLWGVKMGANLPKHTLRCARR